MAFKIVILAAVIAVARAGVIGGPVATYAAAPLLQQAPLAAAPLSYARALPAFQAPTLAYSAAPAIAKVAAPLAYAAPVAKTVVADEYDPNPQYSYGYDVQDGLTGDSKSQVESRSGDVVQGSYSLTDPDGTRRTVDYVADPINGFNAVVRREPLVAKAAVVAAPAVAKVAAPLAYAAPAYTRLAAPLSYGAAPLSYGAAPLSYGAAPLSYAAAPVAKIGAPLAYSTSLLH